MRIRTVLPLILAAPLAAQQPRQLTTDDYARAEKMLTATTTPLVTGARVSPTWLPDGRFWYRTTSSNGIGYYMVDPARKTREAIANPSGLIGTAPRGGDATNSSTSPDGKTIVYIKAFNLWARDVATGAERQLTTDGIQDFAYATDNAGWEHSDQPVITWSSDSKKIATFQHDGRGVRDQVLTSTNVGGPRVEQWKYPLPGDSVVFHISRVIVDVPSGKVTRLNMPPDFHRSTVSDQVNCDGAICDVQWYPDGSKLAFISSSRDHKQAWMRVADAQTGEVRTLFDETSKTQVGDASLTQNLWRVLPASNELIWWSQRDNWLQLYLYDLTTGKLKNKITVDSGNVDNIVRVDEKSRTIYYLGAGAENGQDPYFEHLYKIGLNGKGRALLTPENANHSISMSPDAKYFVDTYSTPSSPPVSVLRDSNGALVESLEKGDVSRLTAIGWHPPVEFKVKARDGKTNVYGLMFTPSNLDSTKKYPIINHIYPGPQTGSVGSRNFAAARGDNQALAELGFIVVEIDGMGTSGRSKSFMDAYYGHLDDNTIPDQVAGMKELASRYPFIDIDKVGIYGHSGGGFATAAAMLRASDFFDVGIAESGNHDNRNYEDDWGERYQGLVVREGASDSYTAEANQTYAANLKGKLLLAHGSMDDNVPPSNTLLLADALIKANKDFDLLIIPNARHGYGSASSYMMRRRWDYFVKNLLGAEPPKEYQIGRR